MTPSGTPALTLPAFKAKPFLDARVAMGATVTSITLEGEGKNVPFKIGHVFKQGDLTPGDALVGRDGGKSYALQFECKATHPDGSVRHALISGVIPTLAGSMKLDLARAPARIGSEVAPPDTGPCSVAVVASGVEYSAAAGGSGLTWMSGPIANETVYNVPFLAADGKPHPDLTAQFCVRHFPGAVAACIDVTLEHTKAYTAVAHAAYDVRILIDGKERFAQAGLLHFVLGRWKKTLWRGDAPDLHIRHDITYLIDTLQVSNYDRRVKVSEATLDGYDKKLGKGFPLMSPGRFAPVMGTTGGRPDIGLAPDSYAATILTMDPRAKRMMLASADAGGSWNTHRRDQSDGPCKGRPLDIIHFQSATLLGNPGDANNPLTGKNEKLPAVQASPLVADSAHQPAFAYIPYLLTGDYYYLEELHFWCNYNLYKSNPGYRLTNRGLINHAELRDQAWTMRTLAQATAITPDDHPSKAAFGYWLDNNLAHYNARYTDGASNRLGINDDTDSVVYASRRGIAPWQDDFFTQAIGHAAELGFTEAARLLKWKAKFSISRMIGPGACFIDAAIYTLIVRDSIDSPIYQTIGECMAETLPAAVLAAGPCNSQARLDYTNSVRAMPSNPLLLNEMTGYSYGSEGYPSNMQPALAMAVDSGYKGGAAAWAAFDGRANQPNYHAGPQFAIVPRVVGADVKLPPTTPTPVPPPPPVPTPPAVPVPPVVTPAPAKVSLTITNERLIAGREYVLTVTSDDGHVIAVQFPVVAQ